MFSLLNRGIIPRAVDLSPAFERGNAPFVHGKATVHEKDKVIPPSKTQLMAPKALKYQANIGNNQHGNSGNTFITAGDQLSQPIITKGYMKQHIGGIDMDPNHYALVLKDTQRAEDELQLGTMNDNRYKVDINDYNDPAQQVHDDEMIRGLMTKT